MTITLISLGIKIPSNATLKKYGMDALDYLEILERQWFVCPICKKRPSSGLFRVDHWHKPNYKKLSPQQRKACVRGLCCVHCNRFYLAKGITPDKARNVATYLEDFEKRKPK